MPASHNASAVLLRALTTELDGATQAVERGTAFLVAVERAVHPNVKPEVVRTGDMRTVIRGMSTGEPCRQISNALSAKLDKIEDDHMRQEAAGLLQNAVESSLRAAMMEGDMENGAVTRGHDVALIARIHPDAEIIDSIVEEARSQIRHSLSDFRLDSMVEGTDARIGGSFR